MNSSSLWTKETMTRPEACGKSPSAEETQSPQKKPHHHQQHLAPLHHAMPPHLSSSSPTAPQGLTVSIEDHFPPPVSLRLSLAAHPRCFQHACPQLCTTFLPLGCGVRSEPPGVGVSTTWRCPTTAGRCAVPAVCTWRGRAMYSPPQTSVRESFSPVCVGCCNKCLVVDPLCAACSSLTPFDLSSHLAPHHILFVAPKQVVFKVNDVPRNLTWVTAKPWKGEGMGTVVGQVLCVGHNQLGQASDHLFFFFLSPV